MSDKLAEIIATKHLEVAALLPRAALLRAGAFRFWLSRLWDFHLPREASMLKPHDPTHFERVLRQRIAHATHMAASALPTAQAA